jgi:hypothetical protein
MLDLLPGRTGSTGYRGKPAVPNSLETLLSSRSLLIRRVPRRGGDEPAGSSPSRSLGGD